MKKMLWPKWELSEPNMDSAARKNADGICAMHECESQLSDPPAYGFLGVKICDQCRKPIDEWLKELERESDRSLIGWIEDIRRHVNGTDN